MHVNHHNQIQAYLRSLTHAKKQKQLLRLSLTGTHSYGSHIQGSTKPIFALLTMNGCSLQAPRLCRSLPPRVLMQWAIRYDIDSSWSCKLPVFRGARIHFISIKKKRLGSRLSTKKNVSSREIACTKTKPNTRTHTHSHTHTHTHTNWWEGEGELSSARCWRGESTREEQPSARLQHQHTHKKRLAERQSSPPIYTQRQCHLKVAPPSPLVSVGMHWQCIWACPRRYVYIIFLFVVFLFFYRFFYLLNNMNEFFNGEMWQT